MRRLARVALALCSLQLAAAVCTSDLFCAPDFGSFSGKTVLGLFMSFVGNFINSIGYIMQKIGYKNLMESQEANPDASIMHERIWVAGFVLYAVGSLTHGAALGFASQALLVPMEGVTLVANAFLAPVFLGEKLGRSEMVGSGICVIGILVTVSFGPNSEVEYTTTNLLEFWYEAQFIVYGTLQIGMGVFAWLALKKVQATNVQENIVYDGTEGTMNLPRAKLCANLHVVIAGVLAAFNVLFLKTVSTVLLNSPEPASERFASPWPYVFLVAFVACNFSMEVWKQKALQQFESVYIVPVFQAILIVLAVLTGGVYFHEFNAMAYLNLVIFFCVGLSTVAIGVFVLAYAAESKFGKILRHKVLAAIKVLRQMGFGTANLSSVQPEEATPPPKPHVLEGLGIAMGGRKSRAVSQGGSKCISPLDSPRHVNVDDMEEKVDSEPQDAFQVSLKAEGASTPIA